MVGGRSGAIWPFLLVLAGLLIAVGIMPPQWGQIARDQTAEQSLSKAWQDLSLSLPPSRASNDAATSLDRARIGLPGTGEHEQPVQWLPAAASPKVAAEPAASRQPEIVLPELPPEPQELVFDGPAIEPLELSAVEAPPRAEPSAAEPEHLVARRSALDTAPAPDARDRRREAFSSSPSVSERPGQANESIWCPPESLLVQLTQLIDIKETAAWAENAMAQVHRLGEMVDGRAAHSPAIFAQLRAAVDQVDPLAARLSDPALATRLRRTGHALRRRLDVWERVVPPLDRLAAAPEVDLNRVRLVLADVNAVMRDSAHGRDWREYLLLEALSEASQDANRDDVDRRTALARQILGRVALESLTESQRSFLASEPLDRLATELRRMAAGAPDRAALLAAMEHYEQTRSVSDARRLADACLWMGLQPEPRLEDLHRRMTMHYRNANLRVELSESFLNRLMPKPMPEYGRVRDTVLGNPVRGQSLTATEVGIRLIPDPGRLRLALAIAGEVASLTSSSSGPAVFQNASESRYVARKPIELTVAGLTFLPAEVEQVSNVTRLWRLQTAFDGVPLIGALVQNVARTQHDMRRAEVRREVEWKVAARAKQRIDDEADARLGQFAERLQSRVLTPMHELSLGPRMIEAVTTEDRMTMRVRVASARQLGAHTPRPKTPADSMASFQVHQTAMNNLVEQLGLDGKTLTLAELRSRLAQRLHWPELEQRQTSRDDVTITFAAKDAVRVACEDGRITLELAVARLDDSTHLWSDFQVRVHYRPRVEGMSAELVRDGAIQLPGRRVPSSAQIPLRGIFSRVFSRSRAYQLIPERLRDNPRMNDLAVTQMTIEDGWVAVALGPKPRLARAATKNPK